MFKVCAQGDPHERQIEIRAKTPESKLLILICVPAYRVFAAVTATPCPVFSHAGSSAVM